jgi:hypothetical protein
MATEFALNVLGYSEVKNAENAPDAADPLSVGLSCQIAGMTRPVVISPSALGAEFYGGGVTSEEVFYCRFGMNLSMFLPSRVQVLKWSDMIPMEHGYLP